MGSVTDISANQSPPLSGFNLFGSDPVLNALVDGVPHSVIEQLADHGQAWGTSETFELGRLANAHPPSLKAYDAVGNRIDAVEFHPAYHALMRRSIAAGLHASIWDAGEGEGSVRTLARAARLYMTVQAEAGHVAPMTTTTAAVAALAHAPDLASQWLPRIRGRAYDPSHRPLGSKDTVTLGAAAAERQGGSDPAAIAAAAEVARDGTWRLAGHKWFVSAPMSDAFLILARADEGLTCFLVPRILPDGKRNGIRLLRLKDKLGSRADAAAEVELVGAIGWLVGGLGRGLTALVDMDALARLDAAVVSVGLMRIALAEAVHFSRHRAAFETPLIDQPLMTRVLADMTIDAVAAAALVFRLAESFDRADNDPAEAAFARLMTPATKYWVTKIAPPLIAEAMECMGANAYVEESRLPRHYRDAPAGVLWPGTGNSLCLDVVGILRRTSEPLEVVLANIEDDLGAAAKSTLNVLRAAAAVALADEGSARILTEQLAMTVAAAALRRRFPSVIGDAFVESRLGASWRSTYGMLDSRFDASAFVNYACPEV